MGNPEFQRGPEMDQEEVETLDMEGKETDPMELPEEAETDSMESFDTVDKESPVEMSAHEIGQQRVEQAMEWASSQWSAFSTKFGGAMESVKRGFFTLIGGTEKAGRAGATAAQEVRREAPVLARDVAGSIVESAQDVRDAATRGIGSARDAVKGRANLAAFEARMLYEYQRDSAQLGVRDARSAVRDGMDALRDRGQKIQNEISSTSRSLGRGAAETRNAVQAEATKVRDTVSRFVEQQQVVASDMILSTVAGSAEMAMYLAEAAKQGIDASVAKAELLKAAGIDLYENQKQLEIEKAQALLKAATNLAKGGAMIGAAPFVAGFKLGEAGYNALDAVSGVAYEKAGEVYFAAKEKYRATQERASIIKRMFGLLVGGAGEIFRTAWTEAAERQAKSNEEKATVRLVKEVASAYASPDATRRTA